MGTLFGTGELICPHHLLWQPSLKWVGIYHGTAAGKERVTQEIAVNGYVSWKLNAGLDSRSLSIHGG